MRMIRTPRTKEVSWKGRCVSPFLVLAWGRFFRFNKKMEMRMINRNILKLSANRNAWLKSIRTPRLIFILKLPVKRIKVTKTTENLVNLVWNFRRRSSPTSFETAVRMVGMRIMELKRIPPTQVKPAIRWIQKFRTLIKSNTTPVYKKTNGGKGNEHPFPFSKVKSINSRKMA